MSFIPDRAHLGRPVGNTPVKFLTLIKMTISKKIVLRLLAIILYIGQGDYSLVLFK